MDEISDKELEGTVNRIFELATEAFDEATGVYLPIDPKLIVREWGQTWTPAGTRYPAIKATVGSQHL